MIPNFVGQSNTEISVWQLREATAFSGHSSYDQETWTRLLVYLGQVTQYTWVQSPQVGVGRMNGFQTVWRDPLCSSGRQRRGWWRNWGLCSYFTRLAPATHLSCCISGLSSLFLSLKIIPKHKTSKVLRNESTKQIGWLETWAVSRELHKYVLKQET